MTTLEADAVSQGADGHDGRTRRMVATEPELRLRDSDLSAVYQAADEVSGTGQRKTKLLIRTELIGLIVASLAGVTVIRVGPNGLDVLAPVSGVAFVVALYCTVRRAQTKPEQNWYEGRAGAESARTLAWKYSIGAEPFPVGGDEHEEKHLARAFLDGLGDVVRYLEYTKLPLPDSEVRELTEPMKRLRAAGLATRRQVYRRDRIKDQLDWYARRSGEHNMSANRWLGLAIASSAAGILMAVAKFLYVDIDLLGVFAAVASAAIGWNQLNQHRNQATAYSVTARELNIILDQIDHVPDSEWASFAEGAEDAISREHTMWAARRGYTRPAG